MYNIVAQVQVYRKEPTMRSHLKGGGVGSLVWKSYLWGPYLMYKKKMIILIALVMDPGGRPHSGPVWTSIAHVQIE